MKFEQQPTIPNNQNISRRDFLKKAVVFGVAAVAVATGLNAIIDGDKERQLEKLTEHIGTASLLEKTHQQPSRLPNFSGRLAVSINMVPEAYILKLEIDGTITDAEVTKEEFEKFSNKDTLPITYKKDKDGKIISVKIR